MRKIWVVALANLAVLGLVLTAIITNVVSACSSADGCGSAPPYVYIGLVLILLGSAGLFLLFRKWRGAAVSAEAASVAADDAAVDAPKRKRTDKTSRAQQREADSEEETSSRNRLGRIRGASTDGAMSDVVIDFSPESMIEATSVAADTEVDWPPAIAADADDGWATEDWDDIAPATQQSMADAAEVTATMPDSVTPDRAVGVDVDDATTAVDDEFGIECPVADMHARRASDDVVTDHAASDGHISLDQIFAGPAAVHGDHVSIESPPATPNWDRADSEQQVPAPASPQRFDDCAPVGFPATVSDLRALIAVLSLDILLDRQAREDIAAWESVLAPLNDSDAVGPADCEAFAQWIDALAERHNADLATTVAHALQQCGGGGHDPYRSAA